MNERTETHACDLIDRQAAIDEIEERKNANGYRNVAVISELNRLEGYIMRLPPAQPDMQPTCNNLATDTISRQAAIGAIEEYADRLQMVNWKENPNVPYKVHSLNWCINTIRDLPSAQPDLQPTCNNLATDTISRRAAMDELIKSYGKDVIEDVN